MSLCHAAEHSLAEVLTSSGVACVNQSRIAVWVISCIAQSVTICQLQVLGFIASHQRHSCSCGVRPEPCCSSLLYVQSAQLNVTGAAKSGDGLQIEAMRQAG